MGFSDPCLEMYIFSRNKLDLGLRATDGGLKSHYKTMYEIATVKKTDTLPPYLPVFLLASQTVKR